MTVSVIAKMSDVIRFCRVNGINNSHLEEHFEGSFYLSRAVLSGMIPEDTAITALQTWFDYCVCDEFLSELGLWTNTDDVIAKRNNDIFQYIMDNLIDLQGFTMTVALADVTVPQEDRTEEFLFNISAEWLLNKMGVDKAQLGG